MQFTENFHQALQDYTFLLEKKYPEKTILEMIATRYSLNHFERSVLYRGVTTQKIAQSRKEKLITIEQLNNRTLHIDLFNVLFTLAAYLRGYPVYCSNDGLVRDASESHGKGDWEVHLDQGLDLLEAFLKGTTIKEAIIYIDNMLEFGLSVSDKIKQLSKMPVPAIKIIKDPSPDHLIKALTDGIISTSDSIIIDKSKLPVFDLSALIIRNTFHKDISSVSDL
jgi:hypothetical protein